MMWDAKQGEESNDFVWAIKNGELDRVKDFIEKNKFDVNVEVNSRYPLHFAADYGQNDVLTFLISKGANVNVEDKHGITALLAAIWEGHTECVKTLLANGAHKNGKAPDGTSYIDAAEKQDIQLLLQTN